MKKSIIAMAVLAASGAAMAQSSVTLYGVADIWVGSLKATVTGGTTPGSARESLVDSSGLATSRFGLKGSEDLGGGLKANFQLEQGFDLSTGTTDAGTAFNRQAWVGLSGGFGEVQLGKVWTSYDDIRASANDTFNANIASSFSTWVGYNDRTNNGLKYISPTFGGFSGSVTYALGEDKNAISNVNGEGSSLMALGAQYAEGPLFVGFGHQTEKANSNGVSLVSVPPFLFSSLPFIPAGSKATYNLLNASYDLGVVKLVGGVNQVKLTGIFLPGDFKANEFNLGVEAPLASNLALGVGYSQSKVKVSGTDLFDTKGFSAALLYNLSKRTTAYAALTQTKATDKLGVLGFDSAKTQLYAVGINHKF